MFYNKKQNKPDISLNIEGQIIAELTSSNFFGVIIDERLNLRDHVSFVSREIAQCPRGHKFVLFIYISLFDILQPNLGICL